MAERTEDAPNAGRRYRFDHLSMRYVLADMSYRRDDPGPDHRVPDFDLPALGGGSFRSTDLAETGPALLVFGSYTCPVTDNAAPGLNKLHLRFGDRVRFVMVNVREAHPGEAVPQPKTLEEKMAHAEQLRNHHGFKFEVTADDLDGMFHRALGPKPNSAYVLAKDGTILLRAHWANDTGALAAALETVTAGAPPSPSQSGGILRATIRFSRDLAPAFDRAGRGA